MTMRQTKLFTLAVILLSSLTTLHASEVGDLRCEYFANPLGIDATQPRLSWVMESDQRGER